MIIINFLKWFFVPSGIVCVEESGQLTWLQAFKRLFSGGVARIPDGPTDQMRLGFARFGKELKRYKCRSCEVHFWAWKKRDVCYKWRCCRES